MMMIALFSSPVGATSTTIINPVSQIVIKAEPAQLILAQTDGMERRDERRDDRQDDRQDRRDDRQDCREEQGVVGKDKRDCKQDGRQERNEDG